MEYPILFSAPMVRAILDDRKTQTRRVVEPQPKPIDECDHGDTFIEGGELRMLRDAGAGLDEYPVRCPFGQPGDTLWVRETFAWSGDSSIPTSERIAKDTPWYRADGKYDSPATKWRSAIHMPRWASRITLLVKVVRVERLQEISGKDILAEGVTCPKHHTDALEHYCDGNCEHLADAFAVLWDSINAKKHPWASNRWVRVVEFERVKEAA